jgi:hypothetical protein
VKFRRKSTTGSVSDSAVPEPEMVDPTSGPFDHDQVNGDGVERADLGALLIPSMPERELRLQIDEKTGAVRAVILAGKDGFAEFQAFAAPRNGDLWETVRPQIAADLESRGGSSTERQGRWGSELICELAVQTPEGPKTQVTRLIGINGPRWMLRATLAGKPALEPEASGDWEDSLAQIVVRRGSHAMPVGEALPVSLPDNARRMG